MLDLQVWLDAQVRAVMRDDLAPAPLPDIPPITFTISAAEGMWVLMLHAPDKTYVLQFNTLADLLVNLNENLTLATRRTS